MAVCHGHNRVAVLDGGWKQWVAEEHPVTGKIPQVNTGSFSPPLNTALRYTKSQVQASLSDENTILVDVRSRAEFTGEVSRSRRTGHIPGAVNLPRKTLLNEDGMLLPIETLKTKFDAAGIPADGRQIIVYCNSGVSASYAMLALKQAGYENISVYDGSWKEWGNDETLPIR